MRVVLVVTALFAALLISGCGLGQPSGSVEPVEMKLLVRNATPPTEEAFLVGDTVRIKDSGTVLGTITDVYVEPSRVAVPDSDGVLQEARSPLLVDVTLTVEGEAVVSEDGYRFGSELVWVNNDIRYLTPLVQFGGIIVEMRVVED